eukprot:jgi/Chlat1/6860/Chrsp51S06569
MRPPLLESKFRRRLIQEIQTKLEQAAVAAVEDSALRKSLLQDLFRDVALEVDAKAQAKLYGAENLPLDRSIPGVALCYYEVLADHYACEQQDVDAIMPHLVTLWSYPTATTIFALLLHEWVFTIPPDMQQPETLKYYNVCFGGASRLFWLDIKSNEQRFAAVFQYFTREVVLDHAVLESIPMSARRELTTMVAKFFLFYSSVEALETVLLDFPSPSTVGLRAHGTAVDIIANEVIHQLQEVKVEPVLVRYLENLRAFKGMRFRTTTSLRLQAALYGLSTPGGPLYPPRSVRHAARFSLNALYPAGRRSRQLVSMVFRLLHPYYWPSSASNFVIMAIRRFWHCNYTVVSAPYRIIQRTFFGKARAHRA